MWVSGPLIAGPGDIGRFEQLLPRQPKRPRCQARPWSALLTGRRFEQLRGVPTWSPPLHFWIPPRS